MPHKQRFCLLSCLLLWYGICGRVGATSTLTVDLTHTEPNTHVTITAPNVCTVKALLPPSYQDCNDDNCTYNVANSQSFERTFQSGSETIQVTINFDPAMRVSCSRHTPHLHLSDIYRLPLSCSPLYACNANLSTDVNEVIWRKFYYMDNLTDYVTSQNVSSFTNYKLVHGRYRPPANITDSTLFTNISLAKKGQELRVVNSSLEPTGTEALGYYVPTIELNNGETGIGPHTIVYIDPTLESDSGSEEVVIQGSGRGRNFNNIHCTFRSFPPVSVVWTSPGDSNFTTRDIIGSATATYIDLELTRSGQVFFNEVQFDDGGNYRCIGDNGVSNVIPSHTTILRVRHPLRPLWPALGIVCSLIITALFILGGTLVDKIRGKHSTTDDEGSFQRNYSIVSNVGEDSNNAMDSQKGHAGAKRLSSAAQELIPNAS